MLTLPPLHCARGDYLCCILDEHYVHCFDKRHMLQLASAKPHKLKLLHPGTPVRCRTATPDTFALPQVSFANEINCTSQPGQTLRVLLLSLSSLV